MSVRLPGAGVMAAAIGPLPPLAPLPSLQDVPHAAPAGLGAAEREALAAAFDDARRLYSIEEIPGSDAGGALPAWPPLLVEAWVGDEALSRPYAWRICALSRDAGLALEALAGRAARLRITLADGSPATRSGLVQVAEALDADGGFARYRLTLVPWLQLLAHRRASRVWQDRGVQQIVDELFAPYAAHAAWRWSGEVAAELAASPDGGVRGLRVQYRETDLSFLHRLLAAEGLGYRFEEDAAAPCGHRLVVFADSAQLPEDASSAAGGGVRLHRSSSQEAADAVQAFGGTRVLPAARSTVLGWDAYAQQARHAGLQAAADHAADAAPALEHYTLAAAAANLSAQLANATAAHIPHRAALLAQALDARHKTWLGRGTLRSLRAGTQLRLRGALPDDAAAAAAGTDAGDRTRFTVLRVLHAGINNLPRALNVHLACALAQAFEGWRDEGLGPDGVDAGAGDGDGGGDGGGDGARDCPPLPPTAELLAQARDSGYANRFLAVRAAVAWRPVPPPPRRAGLQTAIVVGPQGETAPGAGDIHTDRLGRVRVAFHWQQAPDADGRADNRLSCWMRCVQRWAGPGAGSGLGAQFIPRIGQEVLVEFIGADVEHPVVVGALHNGRGAGHGNHPTWQGDGQGGDAAALSGWRSNEFGNRAGTGYNQLLFDDTDGQLAVQAGSTQHATWLNLGHLLHRPRDRRGSPRGLGLELRTDACGSVRAGRGLLLSTWPLQDHEPALDHAAGLALARRHTQLAGRLGEAAIHHQTVAPATVTWDGPPPFGDPIVAVAARAGLGLSAADHLQLHAAGTLHLATGQDLHQAAGGALRIHGGQAIGLLAGAVDDAAAAGGGLTAIAAAGDVALQAQAGALQLAARDDLRLHSAQAFADIAAGQRVVLRTTGGACVTLGEGGLTVEAPGRITVMAATKSLAGPPAGAAPAA